jgi:hypothetical protein
MSKHDPEILTRLYDIVERFDYFYLELKKIKKDVKKVKEKLCNGKCEKD